MNLQATWIWRFWLTKYYFCNIRKLTYYSFILETVNKSSKYHCSSFKGLKVSIFSPFCTFSDYLSLIWPPLSLHPVFSALHPSPLSLSHHPCTSSTLFWFRRTGYVCSPSNKTMKPLSLFPPLFFHTIFIICSYIVCLPVCLPVSFSVPHTSVWQPVVSNKKESVTKPKREQIRGRAEGRLVAALQLWAGASREGSRYFPYCSRPYVATWCCPYTECVQSYPRIASTEARPQPH